MVEYTKELARYSSKLKFGDIPKEAVDQAKYVILDALGSAIGCVNVGDESALIIRNLMVRLGGNKEATVLGVRNKITSVNAALANGALIKGIGFDDYHLSSAMHINTILVPAALATAEMVGAGGRELLTAVVAGYETMVRVGMATSHAADRGFSGTGLCGGFGSAVAAGKLLNLNEKQMVYALGIVGLQSSGISNFKGGHMASYLEMVKPAENGVLAALLAKDGFTSLDTILEDKRGFCTIYVDRPNLNLLTSELGEKYQIMNASFKAYSCEIYLHPGVQALLNIMDNNLSYNNISNIKIRIPPTIIPICGSPEFPSTRFGARISGRYTMAATAVMGKDITFNIKPFQEQALKDERIIRLANSVDVVGDHEMEKDSRADWACGVEVMTNDGRCFKSINDAPKGHFRNPFTPNDHKKKFTALASHTLKQESISKIIEIIFHLEDVEDVGSLMGAINRPILSSLSK